MKRESSVLLIILFFFTSNFLAQKKSFKLDHRSSIDGLSSDWINSLAEDNRGFIWLGSRHGLNIYDGKEFNSLFHRDDDSTTISGNDVSVVLSSKSGHIIAGTWGSGINFIDPISKLISKPEKDSITQNLNIKAIVEKADSSIWIGTYGQGFFKYEKETNRLIKCKYLPTNDTIKSTIYNLCEGMCVHHDTVWLTTNIGGLGYIDPITNTIKTYTHPNFDPSITSNVLTLNSDGDNLLIGTIYSLYRELDTKTGSLKLTQNISKNGKDSLRISSILVDHKGSIWITSSKGVVRKDYKTNEFTFLSKSKDEYDDIYCSLQDSRDILWFGNWGAGLSKHVQEPNQFLEADPGGINNWSMNALNDFNDENLLVGSSKGLFLFNKTTKSITAPILNGENSHVNAIKHRNILGITTYLEDNYLVLIDKLGFYKIDKNLSVSKHTFNHNAIKKESSFSFLKSASNGKIWVGTNSNGLHLHNHITGKNTHFSESKTGSNFINSDKIYSIYVDKSLDTWICTEAGVMKFDNVSKKFIPFTVPLVISDTYTTEMKEVKSMLQDENGDFWFSSSEGLVHYAPSTKSSILYGEESGLSDQAMYHIFKKDHFIWGTTQEGTYSLNLKTKKAKYHTASDGVKVTFSKPTLVFDNDNVYISYINGIESIDPDELVKENVSLKLFIQNFLVNDQEKQGFDTEQKVAKMNSVSLESDENNISIVLSVIDFRKSKHDAFTHQLIGFDKKPIIHDSQFRRIKYTNLDPGEYELIISSIDPSETPRNIGPTTARHGRPGDERGKGQGSFRANT